MGTSAKFIHRIQLEENLFEIKHSIHKNGACQCFKDCDCYSEKGELIGHSVRYSNGIVVNHLGKERTYSSIEGCKSSLKAYQNKIS